MFESMNGHTHTPMPKDDVTLTRDSNIVAQFLHCKFPHSIQSPILPNEGWNRAIQKIVCNRPEMGNNLPNKNPIILLTI